MGIDLHGTEFLLLAHEIGVDFSSTITLGRQSWSFNYHRLRRVAGRFPEAPSVLEGLEPVEHRYAEELLQKLGASVTDSIDYSDFEGATVLHDMNQPIDPQLAGQYSTVIDGGTTEHVFHVSRALENAMTLVAPDGHFLSMTPTNDQVGHGFYQFSPELYFRLFSEANGFQLRHVLMHVHGLRSTWYRLTDPAQLGLRVDFSTLGTADLYVIARRTSSAGLTDTPQQSDYLDKWIGNTQPKPDTRPSLRRSVTDTVRARGGSRVISRAGRTRQLLGRLGSVPGITKVDLAHLASDRTGTTG